MDIYAKDYFLNSVDYSFFKHSTVTKLQATYPRGRRKHLG